MANKYNQISSASQGVHFSQALFGEVERSRMVADPYHLTTFNAGDIIPIYCREVLPNQDSSLDIDFVIRQTTLMTPTMGNMHVDIYAFFVPNRIVNQSWKAVVGENYSGSWTAPQVSLAPLVNTSFGNTQVPVGSIADYYGFPTQQPIPNSVLSLCNDFKFRGYVMIYNEHFRDQNYQPPIPLSTLNIYQGFLSDQSAIYYSPTGSLSLSGVTPDGSVGAGAIAHALAGSAVPVSGPPTNLTGGFVAGFKALNPPLKANKLHDYFTSVLPSPQKSSSSVIVPASGAISSVPVVTSSSSISTSGFPGLRGSSTTGSSLQNGYLALFSGSGSGGTTGYVMSTSGTGADNSSANFVPANLITQEGAEVTGLGISVDDLRMASAIQQVYEVLALGGSRYRELVHSFFGIEADDPYSDVPRCLGHISRDLDLYQTAQTSASETGSTPQGNLSAFGYTSSGGHLYSQTFLEHGYVHVLAVVRHRNLYSSFLARDNFRLNMMDFYWPQLANISEQPVYAREINPFASSPNSAFGYQEAWAEYRYEPNQVSGYMRTGISNSLSIWNYADSFDSSLQIATGEWLKSNSEDVLNRTLAVSSDVAPQFKGMFKFVVDKTLPMPTYSVPGMDII